MPAAATDMFLKVGNPGTATTLSAPGYTIGNTTITVASTTNFPTDTGVIFGIDRAEVEDGEEVRVEGSYCVFSGVVTSATQIGSLTLEYGTPQDYPAGALTRVYITVSALHNERLIDGLLNFVDQDATLKAGAVDNAAVLASNVVTTAKILDANVTTAKVADSAITPAKRSGGFKVGTIPGATLGTTGNKAITGVGFRPRLVRFIALLPSNSGNGQHSVGAMDENGNQYLASTGDTSATATRNSSTTDCLGVLNGGLTTYSVLASYVSMDSDGFTINVSTASSAVPFAYEAYA